MVEEDQELELEDELEFSGFGGGGGIGTGATSDNPWEFEVFYGGDDDDSPAALRRRQRRLKAQINEFQMPEPETPRAPPAAAAQMAQLLPTPRQGKRTGDGVYLAPELALFNPDALYNQSLDPTDLAGRKGKADPIRTPVEIGRFLKKQPTTLLAQSIAEILGAPAAALVVPQGGFSTACARLATLAICSEAALSPQYHPLLVDQAELVEVRDRVEAYRRDVRAGVNPFDGAFPLWRNEQFVAATTEALKSHPSGDGGSRLATFAEMERAVLLEAQRRELRFLNQRLLSKLRL